MDRVASLEAKIADDRLEQHLRDVIHGRQWDAAPAGLTMDADADLHFIVAKLEGRRPSGRHDTTRERHTHRAPIRVDLDCRGSDFGE